MVLKQVLTNYFMAFVKLILIVSTAILIKKIDIHKGNGRKTKEIFRNYSADIISSLLYDSSPSLRDSLRDSPTSRFLCEK